MSGNIENLVLCPAEVVEEEDEEPPPAKKPKTTKNAGPSAKKAEEAGTETGGTESAATGDPSQGSASEEDSSDDDAAIPIPPKGKLGTAKGVQLIFLAIWEFAGAGRSMIFVLSGQISIHAAGRSKTGID